jgi:3-oxoacyl-[acyl-carrier protein] reductase
MPRSFVIGGGSRGLGRAVAEELVRNGDRVLLVARNEDSLAEAVAALGERASSVAADLGSSEGAEVVARAVDERFDGTLDGALVNQGGPPPGNVLELTDEQWQTAFELCIAGPIRLVRTLAPKFADGSSIVFVASSSTRRPIPGLDASNVLRPGVAALVGALARALAPRVRVNAVSPGRFDTERGESVLVARAAARGVSVEEERAAMASLVPAGRFGDTEEFARAVTFLLSPAASYITGANLAVDGGLVMSA